MKSSRRQGLMGWAAWRCPLLVLLSVVLPGQSAKAERKPPPEAVLKALDAGPLSRIDGDAGFVLSMRVSELETLGDLGLASLPEARGSISLATLGVAAFLGWNPLQASAWSKSGFAVDGRLYLQLEAVDAKGKKAPQLWRSRLLLPARDPALAKSKLAAIRFGSRVLLESQGARDIATLLQIKPPMAKRLKERLLTAGVFLIAKPVALPGLLLISQVGKLFIVDHLRLEGPGARNWNKGQTALLAALAAKTNSLATNTEAREALESAGLGLWMNPAVVAETLVVRETSEQTGKGMGANAPGCGALPELARTGYFGALSLRGDLAATQINLELRWHLRKGGSLLPLLTTEETPLVAHQNQALHAILRLDQIGELRKLKRAAMTQTWDALWKQADRCHLVAGAFVMAIDWPHIAGLFLEELSALHPEANTLIDNLGSLVIHSEGAGDQQELLGEAWIRGPGGAIASNWLRTLFGHEKGDAGAVQWGRGPMRPYALAYSNGSVVGSDLLGSAAGHPELSKLRKAARGTRGTNLFSLRATPSALRLGIIKHPLAALLRSWKRISADLTIDKGHLRFTMDLQKD